jgi:hypothetical protein
MFSGRCGAISRLAPRARRASPRRNPANAATQKFNGLLFPSPSEGERRQAEQLQQNRTLGGLFHYGVRNKDRTIWLLWQEIVFEQTARVYRKRLESMRFANFKRQRRKARNSRPDEHKFRCRKLGDPSDALTVREGIGTA